VGANHAVAAMAEKHTHYRDYRDVRGDGRIILYRRADIQSPNWTARLKIPDTVGYVVKSAKTPDDFEARRFAEELYYQLEGRSRRGEPVKSPTFKWVFEQWKASLSMDRKVRSAKYVDGNIRRMEIWALPHLGQLPINTINESILAQHIQWRVDQAKKPPAIATLRTERTVLNQIFRFAKREGYISDTPEITLPTLRQNSRPDIPDKEWRQLYTFLRGYVKDAQDKRRHRERFYLQHYILILANSGIRVGEARHLRRRDISSTKTLSGQKRLIFTVRGKTGEREVVCMEHVERYVERLRKLRSEEVKKLNHDEPIFCHPDGKPIGSFKKGFEHVLDGAGILYGSDGKKRVPYSLRHTYATMRISEGVSVFQLAANMGTSVEMIENFYGKKRMRDPKMATEVTKFRER
jgi:integrase